MLANLVGPIHVAKSNCRRPSGSVVEGILKGVYHIWACDHDYLNI